VVRDNYTGPITVRLRNVPAGMTAPQATILAGASTATLTITTTSGTVNATPVTLVFDYIGAQYFGTAQVSTTVVA
jgi:hypothetical protein